MMRWEIVPTLLYSMFAVHLPDLSPPRNLREPVHSDQGFCLRPGCAEFGTRDANGRSPVVLEVQSAFLAPSEAIRILKVPFEVKAEAVVVADAFNEWEVPVPQGNYALFFTMKPYGEAWKYVLTFVPAKDAVEAEIIRCDEELSPPEKLVMMAEAI